jgi:UDP-glucuronate 4-epimerase
MKGCAHVAALPILVTGAAGFIGFHVARRLLEDGRDVVGIDNLNAYYDPKLKEARLAELARHDKVRFYKLDLSDRAGMAALFADHGFAEVVHLAAQAGVRHSLSAPHDYIDSNISGFLNVLEGCRHARTRHLLYASSSSVYGANTSLPFGVGQNVDHPLSLYGATKKANELMAHAYAHLFGLPVTGLRFFTVYGPWGRPDMAMWLFAAAILEGRPVKLFNSGDMRRDFTYVDDVAISVVKLIDHVAQGNAAWAGDNPDPATSRAPWRIYNIGNHTPVDLMEVVRLFETALGKKAIRELMPMQPGDVRETCADVEDLRKAVGFAPNTPLAVGIKQFVDWFRAYHGI